MKKKTPFLNYYNHVIKVGKLTDFKEIDWFNLTYAQREFILWVRPTTDERIESHEEIHKSDFPGTSLSPLQLNAILLCAALNNELDEIE
jgi:hypothetical protein